MEYDKDATGAGAKMTTEAGAKRPPSANANYGRRKKRTKHERAVLSPHARCYHPEETEEKVIPTLDLQLQFAALCLISHPRCGWLPSENFRLALRLVWDWVNDTGDGDGDNGDYGNGGGRRVRLFCVSVMSVPPCHYEETLITFGVSMATLGVMGKLTSLWKKCEASEVIAINRAHLVERFLCGKAFYQRDRKPVEPHECGDRAGSEVNVDWWRNSKNRALLWEGRRILGLPSYQVNHKWLVIYKYSKGEAIIANLCTTDPEENDGIPPPISRVISAPGQFGRCEFFFIHWHDDEAVIASRNEVNCIELTVLNLLHTWSSNSLKPITCTKCYLPSSGRFVKSGAKYQLYEFSSLVTLRTESHQRTFIVLVKFHNENIVLQLPESSSSVVNSSHYCSTCNYEVVISGLSDSALMTVDHVGCCNCVWGEAGLLLHVRRDSIIVNEAPSGIELCKICVPYIYLELVNTFSFFL
ncbi:hypothetical protein Pelo_14399 [Pelomyxa schiedti]|nr:hypothetical protein Pelo_14399 [Pelomyxa schiedti]